MRFLQDRRRFLATSLAATGAYAVTHQGTTWIVGAGRAWAAEMQVLDPATAETLLQMTRAVYPHDFLGDAPYAKVVQDLDAEAAEALDDPSKADLLRDGALTLDEAAGGSFAKADDGQRLAALESIQTTPFFQAVRGKTIVVLYSQPEVWDAFGYEGPSYEIGGYLYNGVSNLSWLPDPPAEASPPIPQ
jgi:hypothetical protein